MVLGRVCYQCTISKRSIAIKGASITVSNGYAGELAPVQSYYLDNPEDMAYMHATRCPIGNQVAPETSPKLV